MKTKRIDLENELSFDRDNLEEACMTQVSLMCRYSKLFAVAEQLLGAAEENVKTTRSKLVLKVESDTSLLGEGVCKNMQTVEAYYRTRSIYREAVEAEQAARYQYSMMQNAMYTLNHRKFAIEQLLRAHLGNVHSDPTMKDRDNSPASVDTSGSIVKLGQKLRNKQTTLRIKQRLQKERK